MLAREAMPLPQRIGNALRDHRQLIAAVQWSVVGFYLLLLIGPVLLPAAAGEARVLHSLARFAEASFWGLWWPGVILSMMLVGQFWCGLICPDGTLTEFVSRHGKGGKIPAWLRWPALPIALFSVITLFEYALETHSSALGTLLTVGSTSLLAVLCGLFYGRGKRVWCRYACPVGGVFSLLARCAVLHYRVDRAIWDAAPRPAPMPVDCPPLLDIRRLASNEKCNMCGRCSGHRNAVALAWRPLGAEIAGLGDEEIRRWEAAGIVFVLIGLFYGAMHWRHSPWLDWMTAASPVLAAHATLAGFAAVLLPAVALGTAGSLALLASGGGPSPLARRLAYALIPLGGLGLFLGAAEHSLLILHEEGVAVESLLPWLRAITLLAGVLWSGRTGWVVLGRARPHCLRPRQAAFVTTCILLALAYQFAPNPFQP